MFGIKILVQCLYWVVGFILLGPKSWNLWVHECFVAQKLGKEKEKVSVFKKSRLHNSIVENIWLVSQIWIFWFFLIDCSGRDFIIYIYILTLHVCWVYWVTSYKNPINQNFDFFFCPDFISWNLSMTTKIPNPFGFSIQALSFSDQIS